MNDESEFVFAALGGLGEIGMNCALYGLGPARARKWLMVDLGVAFAGEEAPGVDLVMPDLGFIEAVRKDLAGIVITHAHEDHIGDWKIDPTPVIGAPTDEARFRALGEEGVLALVCDSTNVLREGVSPSEREVAATLTDIVGKARGRVVVTTFASNVARLRSAAEAGLAAGRQVCILGRAIERVVAVARECGMLDGVPPFLGMDAFERLPRDKILALATGSQGEPRAALARMASGDHPVAEVHAGDMVIFSSRTIPGNEKAVGKIVNAFAKANVQVVTDRHALVHVSGHPRRAEMAQLYSWLRPTIAVPAHGEPLHLTEHAAFAKAQGASRVIRAFNGDLVRFGPGEAEVIGKVEAGRRLKDGNILLPAEQDCVSQRRRLAFGGVVSIAVALTPRGEMAGDPDVMIAGLPERTRDGAGFDEIIDAAIFETFEGLPRGKRRDPDFLSSAVERAVRGAVNGVWGKKPQVHVLVVEV